MSTSTDAPAGEAMDAVASSGLPPWRRSARRLLGSSASYMLLVLLALFIVFTVLAPDTFPTQGNVRNLVVDTSVFLVMATGMTFVMVAAGFDLSIGSVLVFGGICASKTMTWVGGQGLWTALAGLIAALLGGLVWGLFNGFCITRLRVPALITTLGTLGAALGIANLLTDGNDVATVPDSLIDIQIEYFLGLPWIVWLAVVVVIIGAVVLATTRFGRHTYIVGSNDEAARRAGINVVRIRATVFIISSAFAAIGAIVYSSKVGSVSPSAGGGNTLLFAVGGAVIGGTSLFGGRGRVSNAVIGGAVLATVNNGLGLLGQPASVVFLVNGIVLLLAAGVDVLSRRRSAVPVR